MAQAYTPGLRVTRHAVIRKRRRLPLDGEVVVSEGDRVSRDQVVARTELPGNVSTLNLVNRLSISADELPDYMLVQEGDAVEQGRPLAETRPFIKWFKTVVPSPITGTVESVSTVTGQVLLREPPQPVVVRAFVDGTVVAVLDGQGVDVETSGPYIQGIFGVGGETWGRLRVLNDDPGKDLDPDTIDATCKDAVLVAGRGISRPVLDRAREAGAVGVIGGCIEDRVLQELLGYDLGVAITGTEAIGLTVIVTEGFGSIRMAQKTFEVLKENDGRDCSISGATQIRAGVQRPEILFPSAGPAARGEDREGVSGLQVGALMRGVRMPHFGRIGRIAALPVDLQRIESGARVRVVDVDFEDGTRATLPRANIELIEER